MTIIKLPLTLRSRVKVIGDGNWGLIYIYFIYLLVSAATHDAVVWTWQRVSHVLSRWV